MKTTKILLFSFFMLFALTDMRSEVTPANGSWYFGSSGKEVDNSTYHKNCTCTCDACKNCDHRSPDKPVYYEDYYGGAMSPRDFSEFKNLIAARTFESTKYDMTKSVIDNNLFTTDQVRDILSWFVFESNKIDLAKYAFKNTVDRNNYYKLYDIFVFESNVIDLDNYIKNYR